MVINFVIYKGEIESNARNLRLGEERRNFKSNGGGGGENTSVNTKSKDVRAQFKSQSYYSFTIEQKFLKR